MPIHGFDKFSARQRSAIEQGVFAGTFTAQELVDDVRAFAHFDELNAVARRSALKLLIGSIIGFVVCLWVALALVSELLPFALALPVAAIYFGFRLRKHARFDVSDNVRKVALPFLSVLKQDIAPTEQVQVQLDLALPTDARKRLGASPEYAFGAYDRIVDTHFRDAWFEGSARLIDGTIVRWSVIEEVRESNRSKRNARGKRKTKTRHAKATLIEVAVGLPSKVYRLGADKLAAPAGYQLKLEQSEKRTTLKVASKLKKKSLDPIDPKLLIDAVSLAYRNAAPLSGSAP